MNTDKLKEEFLKEFGYKHYDINNNLAYCEFIDDTVDPQEVADWWIDKIHSREQYLFQKLEEKKRENAYLNSSIMDSGKKSRDDYFYNLALSEAQSLLSVKEKEVTHIRLINY